MIQFQSLVDWLAANGVLFLASLAVWATVTLGAAWCVAARLRQTSPAVRYCVWQFALLGLLVVPMLFALLPGIPLGFALRTRVGTLDSANSLNPSSDRLRPQQAIDFERRSLPESPFVWRADSREPRTTTTPPALANSATRPDSRPGDVATASSAAATPSRIPWPALLFGLWSTGAVIQAFGLVYSIACAWKLVRRAEPLQENAFQRALVDLRRRLSVHRQVRLLKTERTCLPIVVGVFRPRILFPADCNGWTAERIRMVLAHELAHIERRDVFWQLLARTAAAAYWFHPLVWLAVRRMRQERERACDDRVLLAGVKATDYAAGLVGVAAALRGRPLRIAVGIGMAQGWQLEDRVRSILDPALKRGPATARARRGILLSTVCIVLTLGVVRPFSPVADGAAEPPPSEKPTEVKPTESKPSASTPAEPKAAESKAAVSKSAAGKPDIDDEGNQPTKGTIRVRVVDADGKPLGGTKIHASVWTKDEKFKPNRDYESDANGQVDVKLPDTLYILRLWAKKHGYVYQFIHWEQTQPAERKRVPDEYTIHMPTGIVIGGFVTDEESKPIAGVKVQVYRGQFDMLNDDDDTKTDSQGHWMIDTAPPGDDLEVRVIATHPDYVSLRSYADSSFEKPLPIKELRAQTATTVMNRGVRITGTVTDPAGKPVAGRWPFGAIGRIGSTVRSRKFAPMSTASTASRRCRPGQSPRCSLGRCGSRSSPKTGCRKCETSKSAAQIRLSIFGSSPARRCGFGSSIPPVRRCRSCSCRLKTGEAPSRSTTTSIPMFWSRTSRDILTRMAFTSGPGRPTTR